MKTTTERPTAQPSAIALDDLRTVEELAAAYPGKLTVPTLLWQKRHRHANGLADAFVRVGKKDLIVQSRYEAWLGTRAGSLA